MRKLVYLLIVSIMFSIMNTGCDYWQTISIRNKSTDTLWVVSGNSGSDYGDAFLATHSKYGKIIPPDTFLYEVDCAFNTTFDYVIKAEGPEHILIYKKDTVNRYGVDSLYGNKYLVEYVFKSGKIADSNSSIYYPPTKEMINKGVEVYYPEDVPPGPDHR